jgi:uncharacterized membrane protein
MTTAMRTVPDLSVRQLEDWTAFSGGALLLLYGVTTRNRISLCAAAASAPLLYRGLTGSWPLVNGRHTETRSALGAGGLRVREAIRVEVPLEEVYRFWRRLENLPLFMAYLDSVTQSADGRSSHWVARGPAGVSVSWDAEIINEIENRLIAWRSLPGSDIINAGSVKFERARGGSATEITVNLQYAPPAGKSGAALAWLFGRAPSQTIREDMRRFKQLLEAGELAQAVPGDRK